MADVVALLHNLGVTQEQLNKVGSIETAKTTDWNNIITIVGSILPVIIIGVFLVFMLRQAQASTTGHVLRQEQGQDVRQQSAHRHLCRRCRRGRG